MKWSVWAAIATAIVSQAACGDSDTSGDTSPTTSDGGGGGDTAHSDGGGGQSGTGGSETGGGDTGGSASGGGGAASCTAALEQALAPVDSVSAGAVTVLSTSGTTLTLYVDASAGGIGAQNDNPWIYISLHDGTQVKVSDDDSLTSTAWDLGLKRPLLRTNGGDVGAGEGAAALLDKKFDDVTKAEGQAAKLVEEAWFDASCNLDTDPTGAPLTTFSGWYDYDMASHQLSPHPGTYVVKGGDGTIYKLAILDYYATPSGESGENDGGFFKLEVSPL